MRRYPLVTDLALAVVAAIFVLIIAPGLAVAGLVALLVLVVMVTSFVRQGRKRRPRTAARVRRRPTRRL